MFGLNYKQWDNIIFIHIIIWFLVLIFYIFSYDTMLTDIPNTQVFRFLMSKLFGGFFEFISSTIGILISASLIVSLLIRGNHPNRPENHK